MTLPLDRLQAWSAQCKARFEMYSAVQISGYVEGINGTLLYGRVPHARIGDLCLIQQHDGARIMAEIVGFDLQRTVLAALGPLEGISIGALIKPLYQQHSLVVGDHLFGVVLDGFGRSMDGHNRGAFASSGAQGAVAVIRDAPLASERPPISHSLNTGLRAIDGLMTIGEGQRVGVFAGAGCGKTTLLAEIARNVACDVIVFGLIGERGRELREFLDHELDAELRSRTVLICATSDRSSMERARAAFTATAVAEGFRDQGRSTLLIIDSLTRFARAQREIGLAGGEPTGRGGLPPSVYSLLPRLVERAGRTKQGVITALYSVLMEQDSMHDPVADEARSLLDGHIVLSRTLAERGHFPAVDILSSLSRTMNQVVGTDHQQGATQLRRLLAAYDQVEMLLKLGEYQHGHDLYTDYAISSRVNIDNFLKQSLRSPVSLQETLEFLLEVTADAPL
ncbi:FliI/YscN family ATPase [Pseudomonas fluorescens]|uniref:FliI/YscN family ATPase n=1 Tax=Pseudomonas fluorescens TaxID=294 RepID=UPI001BE75B31|nr:FliI/YscN family ATPase [Pseudomonas fluorescens]MBT2375465.1 FliI/YscN family ATPase [Pseudomonas fluorescens]